MVIENTTRQLMAMPVRGAGWVVAIVVLTFGVLLALAGMDYYLNRHGRR